MNIGTEVSIEPRIVPKVGSETGLVGRFPRELEDIHLIDVVRLMVKTILSID